MSLSDEHTAAEAIAAKPTITIVRSKLYPTPGRSYYVAWKWYYEIEGKTAPDGEYWYGQTRLKELENDLKRKFPGHDLKRAWEQDDARS